MSIRRLVIYSEFDYSNSYAAILVFRIKQMVMHELLELEGWPPLKVFEIQLKALSIYPWKLRAWIEVGKGFVTTRLVDEGYKIFYPHHLTNRK